MPSITYCIGYFLAILVVNVLGSDYHFLSEPNLTLSYAPHNFYYTSHEFLMMEIILKNISPSVTAVHLQYKYPYMELKVNIEKPNENEVKFMILKHLVSEYTSVNLELHSQSKICGTANIAEGRDGTTLIPYRKESKVFNYQYNKVYHEAIYCVAPNPCRIIVDLRNQCQEQTLADVSCNIEKSQYICTINKQQNTMTFYQTYRDGSNIGSALKMEMSEWTTTKLIINLELFDNNTLVKIGTTRNEIILDKELSFTADDINSEDYGSMTIRYSESTDVEYRCQEPKEYRTKYKVHVVALINTTDNKITTHNTTLIQRKFKMADNGTILCCLCYVFATSYNSMDGKKVSIITRNVKNKTLLFYEAQESISNNFTESKEQTKAALADWLIYLVPTFLGISVLMLALYIIIKQKHCCTNLQPVEETVELDNCATQNQVLYANLDLVRDGHQPESQREESHYANIIGSLHPLR